MIPKEIFIVPLFQIILKFNLSDSYMGMILPNVATTFGVFLLKGFFDSVPDSIRESGRLDGAKEMTIFIKLIMPIVKPGIGALFILNFVNVWNDYLWPSLVFTSSNLLTAQIGLNSITSNENTTMGQTLAVITMVTIPVIIIYSLFSKQIVEGVTSTGSKEG